MGAFSGVGVTVLVLGSQLCMLGMGVAFKVAIRTRDIALVDSALSDTAPAASSHLGEGWQAESGSNPEGNTLKDASVIAYSPPNKGGPRKGTGGSSTR
ncbi:hypothetical protein K9N68_31585 [Kovacikia minuta CCNUW1]|uniref:hypothetical protein n=1 Tax=Kovacikia minuta TaxID=2931930 RepID=UPI001CCD1FF6|nr:hypothetical protein [Kovacikia minuta]UBF26028.1 hypothetical protein K9N68_31585 [Kovacikia minuta CCNUW1]